MKNELFKRLLSFGFSPFNAASLIFSKSSLKCNANSGYCYRKILKKLFNPLSQKIIAVAQNISE